MKFQDIHYVEHLSLNTSCEFHYDDITVTSYKHYSLAMLQLKAFRNKQHSVIHCLWPNGLSTDVIHTVRCIQCMVTSIMRDQQHMSVMFGVRSLLTVKKVLMKNNILAMQRVISSQQCPFIRHSQAC